MALRTPLSVTPHLYMGDSTGRPLDMGTVYFGEQDKDPEFYPINLFSDDALTKPLMQPVHTKGGYLYDKGDMVEPHAKEIIYSVKVLDSYGRKVFYKGAMMRNSWNDDVIEQINAAIVASTDIARQIATDITNDAINNTAIEGGVLADTFVTVTPTASGTVARNQRQKNNDLVSVKDFGAKGDGVTDDAQKIQANIDYVQNGRGSYVFIPTNEEDYLIKAPLIISKGGVMLFGFKGVGYGQGFIRNGNLVIDSTADYAVDFGGNRTASSFGTNAESYTLKNIGIKQAAGIANRTKDGVRYTSQTDGPDRGGVIREVTFDKLDHAIRVPFTTKSTSYATMIIENCVINICNYALYAEGVVNGLRFVGNQAEQNSKGAVHGTFSGSIYIADNMLEGQRDVINIKIPPTYGNKPKLVVERNYFEQNSGDYVMAFDNSHPDAVIKVLDNYTQAIPATLDYIRINTKGGALTIINNDPQPVTFMDTPIVKPDSSFITDAIDYYRIRKTSAAGLGPKLFMPNFMSLEDKQNHTHISFRGGNLVETPMGTLPYHSGSSYVTNIAVPVEVGDIISFNLLVKFNSSGTGNIIPQVFNADYSASVGENPMDMERFTHNKWMLVNFTVRSKVASTKMNFRLYSPSTAHDYNLVGMAVKNYGAIPEAGTVSIFPTKPKAMQPLKAVVPYTPAPIAPSTQTSVVSGLAGSRFGDLVRVSYNKPLQGLQVWAEVSNNGQVTVYIRNNTAGPITLEAGSFNLSIS